MFAGVRPRRLPMDTVYMWASKWQNGIDMLGSPWRGGHNMQTDDARARGSEDCDGQCMERIRLFAGLPDQARKELARRSVHDSYPRGAVLVREGNPIDSILIVRHGRIKTFRQDPDGEEYVLDVLHDGQAIWHGMFLEDSVYHYSVGCLTPVDLCRIRRADFEALLSRDPQMAFGLIRMVCTELDDAEEKVMILSIRDPRRRLAEYLLHRERRCMHGEISLKLADIARSVSLRPETVSRTISAFERQGLVQRLGRGRLKLLDHAGMTRVANGAK